MKTITIKTKSGTTYVLRGGRYTRNNGIDWTISECFFFEADELKNHETTRDFHLNGKKFDEPRPGLHMYIAGRDEWWYSTEIISVEVEEKE